MFYADKIQFIEKIDRSGVSENNMLDLSKCKIMKRGILLYDKTIEYNVIIIESNILYGTGDCEDPPEIAEDKECLCYYVWHDSPSRRNEFYSGYFTAFMSVEEAMQTIEQVPYFSHWLNGSD